MSADSVTADSAFVMGGAGEGVRGNSRGVQLVGGAEASGRQGATAWVYAVPGA